MAYIDQEKKARIAEQIKKVMPRDWKYSLAVRHHSTIVLTVLEAPFDPFAKTGAGISREDRAEKIAQARARGYTDVNLYWLETGCAAAAPDELTVLKGIKKALNLDNHDRSDAMSDYSDVGHYTELRFGKYDRPFKMTEPGPQLDERRRADRIEMARAVCALADEFDMPHELRHSDVGTRIEEHRIEVEVGRGLRVAVEFNADTSQPNVHVVMWHTIGRDYARLSPAFGKTGGEVNAAHFGKCSSVSYGFTRLLHDLRVGFLMARDGSAFQDGKPAMAANVQLGRDAPETEAEAGGQEDLEEAEEASDRPRG